MSTIAGPVTDTMSRPALAERLAFNNGALLDADQLRLEQHYHRSRLGRALAYLHGYGTIAGLNVVVGPLAAAPADGPQVQVAPGLALDRLGRLIELQSQSCLRLRLWFDQMVATPLGSARAEAARRNAGGGLPEHIVADVYIAFVACRRVPEPAFATGNADQIDAIEASRILDAARLSLLVRRANDDRLPAPTISVPAAAPAAMRNAIRDAKRMQLWSALRVDGEPPHLPHGGTITEHEPPEQDGSEVFLARLILPVARDGGGTLRFDSGQPVQVRQDARLYVYSAAELALFTALGG